MNRLSLPSYRADLHAKAKATAEAAPVAVSFSKKRRDAPSAVDTLREQQGKLKRAKTSIRGLWDKVSSLYAAPQETARPHTRRSGARPLSMLDFPDTQEILRNSSSIQSLGSITDNRADRLPPVAWQPIKRSQGLKDLDGFAVPHARTTAPGPLPVDAQEANFQEFSLAFDRA